MPSTGNLFGFAELVLELELQDTINDRLFSREPGFRQEEAFELDRRRLILSTPSGLITLSSFIIGLQRVHQTKTIR